LKNLEALQIERGQLETAEQKLPEMQAEVALLKQKLVEARLQLPSRREMPDLLSSVSDKAKESGLEVELFRPGPEVVRNFYAEVPLTFSLRGTFHQVGNFFDAVGRLSRIVTVSDISLKSENHVPGKGDNIPEQELEAICTATAYRLLDDGEAKAVNDDGVDVG
jgi:type IV pilus assembly protein PilO